ncbi:MAG TPA: cytidine deaminase [Gemmatimonadaceae bacterium]|nr:cytidine deaminase [Gemmatimonadaceae bacterium]
MTADVWVELEQAARRVMEQAYVPYSSFRVGAAVRGEDGSVVVGCNVENASFPAGICAERAAVASAVARGVRRFTHVVIATEADSPTPPCGMCRQVFVEFATSGDLEILSVTRDGASARWRLAQLAPSPFTTDSLSHH